MRLFSLPRAAVAVIFDLDSTLYTHAEYARSQIALPVARLARLRGLPFQQMEAELSRCRSEWAAAHGGEQLSLANALAALGVPIAESAKWREELYQPEQFLAPDPRLRSALESLAARFALAIVTNNAAAIARRTLAALGADGIVQTIVGLDTCGVSKPHPAPFLTAAGLCGAQPRQCVSVGDRYDIDIARPLELGMGGILVDGVQDVYQLPRLL